MTQARTQARICGVEATTSALHSPVSIHASASRRACRGDRIGPVQLTFPVFRRVRRT